MNPATTTRMLWMGARAKQLWQAIARHHHKAAPPDLLIVGAQKAGTTSLFNYLNARPGLAGAQRKEVGFFNRDDLYARGPAWYERFFNARYPGLMFEATPEYLYNPDVPRRIYENYPHVRIVIVLRDPVARAYSAWNMYRNWAKSRFVPLELWQRRRNNPLFAFFFQGKVPSFEECIDHELRLLESTKAPLEPSILRRGIYVDQVARYLDYFDSRQLLVLGFQELREQPKATVGKVVEFADPRNKKAPPATSPGYIHNSGVYSNECPVPLARRLQDFYRPYTERLWELLARRVAW